MMNRAFKPCCEISLDPSVELSSMSAVAQPSASAQVGAITDTDAGEDFSGAPRWDPLCGISVGPVLSPNVDSHQRWSRPQ
jgi:hypothetical protein